MGYWTIDFDEVECKTIWGETWDKVSTAAYWHLPIVFSLLHSSSGMRQTRRSRTSFRI